MSRLEMPQCPYCKGESRFHVSVKSDRLFRCISCGLIYIYPYPSEQEMVSRHTSPEYANEDYFVAGEALVSGGGNSTHTHFLKLLKSSLPKGAVLLDIGAGTGDFLAEASDYFSIKAIEPSPELAEKIRQRLKCPVYQGSFESYPATETVDAVVMLDIIEHLSNPRSFMDRVNKILKPNGILLVTTVNSRALFFRIGYAVARLCRFSKKFEYILGKIFCRQHNWYFNMQVLDGVLTQAGFTKLQHCDYEYPLGRVNESLWMKIALRVLFIFQKFTGATEQFFLGMKL